jgi:hypothetical protein
MEFDITHLDKKLVIQTLFAHSAPLSLGKLEYEFRKANDDNVDGLSDEECEFILLEFNELDTGNLRLLDYHKGKPMKLNFEKKSNGRILVSSDSYDVRNGKYRFLEAFLNIFSMDEIYITKKGYRHFVMTDLQEHLIRPKEQENIFKTLIKNTIQKQNDQGKFWTIDESKAKYKSAFML